MIWIALTGSIFSAWSMFRLMGHERDSRTQTAWACKLAQAAADQSSPRAPAPPTAH